MSHEYSLSAGLRRPLSTQLRQPESPKSRLKILGAIEYQVDARTSERRERERESD